MRYSGGLFLAVVLVEVILLVVHVHFLKRLRLYKPESRFNSRGKGQLIYDKMSLTSSGFRWTKVRIDSLWFDRSLIRQ